MPTELSRQEKKQLRSQGWTSEQIREFEKNGGESSKDLADLQQKATDQMLDRFAVTSEQKVSTDQLKQDIALNRAMDAVLDRYGVNKVNKKRLDYLVQQGVYKRNPDMQWFEMVRTPNTDIERRKVQRFNTRARKNSCKTLQTMVQYDQDNNARIENENKSYYLAWKNKRLEAEPKYKDLIHAIGYVPTIARDEVVQEGLNPEQVILQMKEDFDNNIKYYEAIRVLQQLQKDYGVGPESKMTGTGYQGNIPSHTQTGSNSAQTGTSGGGSPSSPTAPMWKTIKNCGLMGAVNNVLNYTNATPGQKGFINTVAQMAVVGGGIRAGWTFLKSLRNGDGWIAGTKEKSPRTNRLITLGTALGIYTGTAMAFGRNPFQVANDLVFGGPTTQKIGQFVDQIGNAGSQAGGEALAGLQNTIQTSVKTAEKHQQDINSMVIGPLWTSMLLGDMTVKDIVSNGIVTQESNKMVCNVTQLQHYAQQCLNSSDPKLVARGQKINGFLQDAKDRQQITDEQISTMIINGLSAMGIGVIALQDNKSVPYGTKTISQYYEKHNTVWTQFNTYLNGRGIQTRKGLTSQQLQQELETFVKDGQLSDLDIDHLIKKGVLETQPGKARILDPIYTVDSTVLSDTDKTMLNVARNQVNQILDLSNKANDQITFAYEAQDKTLYVSRHDVQVQIRQAQDGLWYFGNFPRGYKLPAQAGEFILGANLMCKIISLYQGKGEQKPYFQYQPRTNLKVRNTTGSDIEFNKKGALDTEIVGGGLWSNLAEMMPMINSHLDEFVGSLNDMPYFDPSYTQVSNIIRVNHTTSQGQTPPSSRMPNNLSPSLTPSSQTSYEQYIQQKHGIGSILNPTHSDVIINGVQISQSTLDAIQKIKTDPTFECKDDRQGAIINGTDLKGKSLTMEPCTPEEYQQCLKVVEKVLSYYPDKMFKGLQHILVQKNFAIGGKPTGISGMYVLGTNTLAIDRSIASIDPNEFERVLHHELSHFIHEYHSIKQGSDLYQDLKKDYTLRKITQSSDLYCDVTDLQIMQDKLIQKVVPFADQYPTLIQQLKQDQVSSPASSKEIVETYANSLGAAQKQDLLTQRNEIVSFQKQYNFKFDQLDINNDDIVDGLATEYGGTAVWEDVATVADSVVSSTPGLLDMLRRAKTDQVLKYKIELMTGCRLVNHPQQNDRLTFGSAFTAQDRQKLGFDQKGGFYTERSGGRMDLHYRKQLEAGTRKVYTPDYAASTPTPNQYNPPTNTTPGLTGMEGADIYDKPLSTLSSLTAQDKKLLIQARKDINTKLDYTNHTTNNIKFVVEGNMLLVKGGYVPIQLSKQADGKWQLANFPILFDPNQLSEALYIANLTGFYISKLHNQGVKAQPWEVSSRTDGNSITGRDIEFEHKENTFNRIGIETTTITGGRRGRLGDFAPSIDKINAKQYYVDRLNTMPYRKDYTNPLPSYGLPLNTPTNTNTNTNTNTTIPALNQQTSLPDHSHYTLDTGNQGEAYNTPNADKSSRINKLNAMLSTTVDAKKSIKQISDEEINKQFTNYNRELFQTAGTISYIRDGDMIKIKYRQQTLDLALGTLEECMRTLNLIDYALDYIAQNKISLYDLKIGTKENVGIAQAVLNGGGSIEGYLYRPRDIPNGRLIHDLIITPQDIVEAVGLGGKTNEELTRDPLLRRQVNNFKTFMNAMRIVLQHNI